MGNLFWKKTTKNLQSKITNQDRAVLQLKQQRDKLQQYQKQVIAQLERDREVAILLLRDGRKDRAKLMLKKKKFQESLLDKTHVQLDNLAKLVHDLEFAQIEVEVVKGLEVGNAALKKMHQILTVEDVEQIMDETLDGIEKQKEIDGLLTGRLSQQDEADVLSELEDILSQNVGDNLNLPDVPSDDDIRHKEKTSRGEVVGERQAVAVS